MPIEIKVPEVSEGIHQATVVAIAVAVDDEVEADQTLLEVETDKAVVAIPSPQAGRIAEIKVKEGDEVEIGAVIMLLDAEGESKDAEPKRDEEAGAEKEAEPEQEAAAEADEKPEPKPDEEAEAEEETGPEKDEEAEAGEEPEEEAEPAEAEEAEPEGKPDLSTRRSGDRVAPAAPSVRRMARELGVDIYQVQGSGPGGRISETDVRHFVRDTMQRITGGGPAPSAVGEFPGLHAQRPLPDFTRWGEVSREPLSRVRELTADAMSYAWSTIPMVTQYDQARISAVENYRREYNSRVEEEAGLTLTAILVKICAAALKAFPRFNSSIDLAARELILKQSIHIGVAVDTPRGLLVPVLRDADRKGMEKLARELNAIAAKTREGKLATGDMEGGTFTISNLGGIGGRAFTPLVYAPQAAILGVSRAQMQPVWDGEKFVAELILPLALSYDHRVVDGADGARFLRWVCEAIENPLQLVMKG
jgi:pyruvate dehydrogenase E2 component (dihydrolipoamide acetyltransferase)